MQPLKKLEELLFHYELKEIYSAESLMYNALMRFDALTEKQYLRYFLSTQLIEIETHKQRLQDVGDLLQLKMAGKTCIEIKELIQNSRSLHTEKGLNKSSDSDIMNEVQRMGQYQLCAYARGIEFARTLQQKKIAKKLEQILEEKTVACCELSTLMAAEMNRRSQPRLRNAKTAG